MKKEEGKKINLPKIDFKENKKPILIGAGVVVAIVVVVLMIVLIPWGGGQEKELTSNLEKLGVEFYENFYYKQVGSTDEERAEFVKKYETTGIKINLDNLSRYNSDKNKEVIESFVNKKTNKECDKENSKVTIYPKSPYKAKDYKIEVNLECGFDKKDKKDNKDDEKEETTTTTTTTTKTTKKNKK